MNDRLQEAEKEGALVEGEYVVWVVGERRLH